MEYTDSDGQVLTVNINNKDKQYYNSKNQLHRLDGPAIEWGDGSVVWYQNDNRHRIGGPARCYKYGIISWWINGYCVNIYYICG